MTGKRKLGGVLASVQPSYLPLADVPGAFIMTMQTMRISGFGLAQIYTLRLSSAVRCPVCGTSSLSYRMMNVPYTIDLAPAERPAFSLVCDGHNLAPAARHEQ